MSDVAEHPNPDLIKITEIFLVPSSFLVAALGTADTNPHRAAVSLLGLIVSSMWQVAGRDALADFTFTDSGDNPRRVPLRIQTLSRLPMIFVLGWLSSLVIHCVLWQIPLGK